MEKNYDSVPIDDDDDDDNNNNGGNDNYEEDGVVNEMYYNL